LKAKKLIVPYRNWIERLKRTTNRGYKGIGYRGPGKREKTVIDGGCQRPKPVGKEEKGH
jgi:hypothetical protein